MNYVSNLSSLMKEKYNVKGNIDLNVFKKMTDFAVNYHSSLIGIINYEVAKLKGEKSFTIMRSTGIGDDNYGTNINHTEMYLSKNKIEYKKETNIF